MNRETYHKDMQRYAKFQQAQMQSIEHGWGYDPESSLTGPRLYFNILGGTFLGTIYILSAFFFLFVMISDGKIGFIQLISTIIAVIIILPLGLRLLDLSITGLILKSSPYSQSSIHRSISERFINVHIKKLILHHPLLSVLASAFFLTIYDVMLIMLAYESGTLISFVLALFFFSLLLFDLYSGIGLLRNMKSNRENNEKNMTELQHILKEEKLTKP